MRDQQMKRGEDIQVFLHIQRVLRTVRISCLEVLKEVYCRWWFPKCDVTSAKVTGRPLCREACEYCVRACEKELSQLAIFRSHNGLKDVPIIWNIDQCRKFHYKNGGDTPECYYPRSLNSKFTNINQYKLKV